MRTDVLTDPQVQEILAADFACAWTDIRREETAGASWRHEPDTKAPACETADGEHNTQFFILTADGRLIGVRAGFLEAKDLARELRWAATELRPVVEDPALKPRERVSRLRSLVMKKTENRSRNERRDADFLYGHLEEDWVTLDVAPLVAGRGFGDHFFGKHAGDPPAGTVGAASADRREEAEALRGVTARPARRAKSRDSEAPADPKGDGSIE